MRKKYLNNHFDPSKLMNVFDELPLWSAPFGLKLLEAVKLKHDITAVDIGFGSGFPLTELAMRLGNSSVVYGIDPWKEAIDKTKEKVDYYGITSIKLIEGVAESIPLENDSVELITSNNGLNNVEDLEKALSECSRILKPGGQFVQTMNLDKSMFEFYVQMEHALAEMSMPDEIEMMHYHIAQKRPPIESVINSLNKHDFIIRKLEYDQFNYRFADGTTMLNHYFIRLAFMDSWIAILPEEKVEEVFDRIELKLNEYAQLNGELNLSIPFVLIDATKNN